MKVLLVVAAISPVMLVPDSLWIDQEAARLMRELQLASEEPVQGEPPSVSKLRNEIGANWDTLIGPKLILEVDE